MIELLTVENITKFGAFIVLVWLFIKQNKLMDTEREQLKGRIVVLESDVKSNNEYIRKELTDLLKENSKALLQMNETITEQTKSFRDLQDKIGKIGR